MSSVATRHKLIKKIKDEKFDVEKLQRYILLTQIGAKDFQVAVIDGDDDRLIFFEDYVFNEVSSQEKLQEALQELFDSHEYLLAGFWKEVKVSIKNNKFIQVPASLFVESAANEYLAFNAVIDSGKESVQICRNSRTDAVTIFAVQNDMMAWLKRVYANTSVSIFHQSASLIEGVLTSAGNSEEQPLFVYVDRFKLHILFVKAGKLVYYNQFIIKQFADYIKCIMLVMKAMGMDQATSRVVLWGYIGNNSPHYQEFIKQIAKFEMLGSSAKRHVPDEFDEFLIVR